MTVLIVYKLQLVSASDNYILCNSIGVLSLEIFTNNCN